MDTRSATALQSMEIVSDTILSGRVKVTIAGGFDDLCKEGSYKFGNMKATSNSETELAMGREPMEMSRTTRAWVRFLIILTELQFANLMTSSSWSLKVLAYTLSCRPILLLRLVVQFVVYSPSPPLQREFTYTPPITHY